MTPVIFGIAAPYNEVIFHHGEFEMLDRGAFADTLKSSKRIALLRDHQFGEVIGSTADLLELQESPSGLAFRVSRFPETAQGRHFRYMIVEARFDSVSVNFDYNAARKEMRRINDVDVCCLVQADLRSVSIMSGYDAGAYSRSFAAYGECENLNDHLRLAAEGAAVQFRRAVRRFQISQ